MPDTQAGTLNGLDEILTPTHTAMLVIDMQNDFCAEHGYIHTTQGADMGGNKSLADRIGRLVAAARASGVMVVWIKAIYDHNLLPAPMLSKMLEKGKGDVCCASDSWGAEFYEIGPVEGEMVGPGSRAGRAHRGAGRGYTLRREDIFAESTQRLPWRASSRAR